jgi:hypothetical protein
MKSGFVVYGCAIAVAEKAKKAGKPPKVLPLSQSYATKDAAVIFVRLARVTHSHLEVRQQ